MKREIKFRLRDHKNKPVGYVKWYEGAWNNVGEAYMAHPRWLYSTDGKTWEPDEIISRYKDQYTGLKDKNGKEIYEGDHDQDFQVVTWCDKKHGWTLSTYDFPTKEFIHCNCYNCEGNFEIDEQPIEVIGNIYEP